MKITADIRICKEDLQTILTKYIEDLAGHKVVNLDFKITNRYSGYGPNEHATPELDALVATVNVDNIVPLTVQSCNELEWKRRIKHHQEQTLEEIG